jgi:hypothetical protein
MEIHSRDEHHSDINTILAGVLIGIVVPFIIFVGYWYLKIYPGADLFLYINTIKFSGLVSMLSICALPVPVIYWYFLVKKHYDEACKGMMAVIIMLLIFTVIFKIL